MGIRRYEAGLFERYGIAVLAAVIAFAASYLTRPYLNTIPWFFFFTAIMVSAWFGGLGPSIVTTAILVVAGRYFFIKPFGTFTYTTDSLFQTLLFTGVSLFIGFLASARRRAERYERAESRRFQATVMSIADAVIATDAAGRVSFMNGVAERLTGWNTTGAKSRRLDEVFQVVSEGESNPAPGDKGVAAIRTPGFPSQMVLIARDGSLRPIEGNAAPIKDDRGEATGVVLVFRDIRDRKEAEEATRRRAAQLQRLAEIATRISAARDVDSVVGVVTQEACSLIGARQAATSVVLTPLHPQPITTIATATDQEYQRETPTVDGPAFCQFLTAMTRPIRLAQDELAHDPRWRALQKVALVIPKSNGWLAAPLVGRDGKNVGLLQLADKTDGEFTAENEAILVQLTRLAAIAIENAKLYDELKTNDQHKDEFLAMLAHELRNPLAAIGNAVSVTTQDQNKENVDWSMEIIKRQMKHLTRLIEDLLDVSRISRGKITLVKDVLEASPILDSAIATVRPLLEKRKHALAISIDRGALWVNADPTRLEQMVVNLLNNAAKFSENGGRIELVAGRDGEDVVFFVRDQGVGIRPEQLAGMFELFVQGDRSLARSEGGLGIGLTVVKKLVEMHGGSVAARSDGPGKGSEFSLRIPAAKRPETATSAEAEPTPKDARSARILVVDDNVDMARGISMLLTLIGHDVATAHDGPAALEAARRFLPEFILLDIGLPGMDGYEVASRLRREPCSKDAVIVAITGYGRDEDRRRSKAAGFDYHLIKPLDHDALLSVLSTAGAGGN